jgi:hypothetical protein
MLRIQARSGATIGEKLIAIDYKFTDAYGQPLFSPYWAALRASQGVLDTTLTLPFVSRTFKLIYRIVTPDTIYQSEIPDLAIGHVIGVAGQSNAEGWSPPPYPMPIGDVRVLRGERYWEYGSNPSGRRWNGPWVYMANKFRELVPDGLPIGIVNTAEGGTSLVAWSANGDWKRTASLPDDKATIYGNALRMFRCAGGNMEAICWIQGEADVVSTSVDEYREAFKQLVLNFESDLQRTQRFYHLQISGQVGNLMEWRPLGWGWIREAQRELFGSKLVGSAVGYPLSFDGIHYEVTTTAAVGHRFAAALATEQYGVENPLYPPITVDSVLLVDIDTDRAELGKKILVKCVQGAKPAGLIEGQSYRGFELMHGERRYGTTEVIASAHEFLSGWIEVRLRHSVITDSGWSVSYGIRGDVQEANVFDTCKASILPNNLVAFLDVPAIPGVEPKKPGPVLEVREVAPGGECQYRWFDLLGNEVGAGQKADGLPAGTYLFVKICGGEITTSKRILLPR